MRSSAASNSEGRIAVVKFVATAPNLQPGTLPGQDAQSSLISISTTQSAGPMTSDGDGVVDVSMTVVLLDVAGSGFVVKFRVKFENIEGAGVVAACEVVVVLLEIVGAETSAKQASLQLILNMPGL